MEDYNFTDVAELKQFLLRQETIDPQAQETFAYSGPNEMRGDFPVGKLGNQAGGYPFEALGHLWKGSEFLYMIGRWSWEGEDALRIQQDVLSAKSGYAVALFKKNKYKKQSRSDFEAWRHEWMLWVVWQKCCGNADFRRLLLATGDALIAEVVKRDPVWAVHDDGTGKLVGANGMGKVLMLCRHALQTNTTPLIDTKRLNEAGIWILGKRLTANGEKP